MDPSQVSYQQSSFSEYAEEYKIINDVWDLLAKTEDLKRYLPARQNESVNSYTLRLQTTQLPRTYRDSIEQSGGRIGTAQVSENAPDAIKALEINADGQSKALDTLVFEAFVHLLKYGCVVGLVDVLNGRAGIQLIPVTAIRNILMEDNKVTRLVIESESAAYEAYGSKTVKTYREYLTEELKVWEKGDDNELVLSKVTPLTQADQSPRSEVYVVWFGMIGSTPWKPPVPPLLDLAKNCILQMHKVSDLDRAETISNLPPIKRILAPGADAKKKQPDIIWDPEAVLEVPNGGDVRLAEALGASLVPMHQRNLDRQAQMDATVDSYLNERVRTDYQAQQIDKAETSRLELMIKGLQQGFKSCFNFVMQLSDRRFNPMADDPGNLILTATAYDQVTDDEMRLLAEQFNAQLLPLAAAQEIAIQQWKSRGYDITDTPLGIPANPIIEEG